MKLPLYSPALKSDIYFTNKGWNHLVHKGTRSFNDVYRRLKLIPYIKSIILNSKTYKTRMMTDSITSFQISGQRTITICGRTKKKLIKVVIILTAQKKYTFLSVM
jgi:hypothetical protein